MIKNYDAVINMQDCVAHFCGNQAKVGLSCVQTNDGDT
jgi:hypothetical protein